MNGSGLKGKIAKKGIKESVCNNLSPLIADIV